MEYKHTIHELSSEEKEFIRQLNPMDFQLHMLAQKMLGSSYFVEKTPQFKKWKETKNKEATTLKKSPQGVN
jgi:hypothetical protein